MSWEDRDYSDHDSRQGGYGGDWEGVRPTLDNPMSWALPIGRYFGITVRVHLIFVLILFVFLLRAGLGDANSGSQLDFLPMLLTFGLLFAIVLLHEFGHCFACRHANGSASEILMWPLGGLAFCRPPQQWKAHLITAVGGPMVNVVICAALIPTLGIMTGTWWGLAIPNPLAPDPGAVAHSVPLLILYLTNYVSLLLLLFNLLPMFPLDGGRITQALLWPRLGYVRSMRVAVYCGYFGGLALLVFGLAIGYLMLALIGAFGIITCYHTVQQLKFTEDMLGVESDAYAVSVHAHDQEEAEERKPTRAEVKAAKRAEAQAEEEAEVDRLLEKISRSGKDSLSAREKRLLDRVSRRKREQES